MPQFVAKCFILYSEKRQGDCAFQKKRNEISDRDRDDAGERDLAVTTLNFDLFTGSQSHGMEALSLPKLRTKVRFSISAMAAEEAAMSSAPCPLVETLLMTTAQYPNLTPGLQPYATRYSKAKARRIDVVIPNGEALREVR